MRAADSVRRVVRAERVSIDGVELRVNADGKKGVFLEIVEAAKEQLDAMLSHHARVLVVRLDIRQHDYTADNKPMSRFMAKLIKRLKRRYETDRIGFVWVREMERAKHQHYHLALMLDGRKVRHPARIIELVEEIAERWDWPKPYTPERCYYLVHRNDSEAYRDAMYRLSYMAKERGKGYKAGTANNYGRSAVKPRREVREMVA